MFSLIGFVVNLAAALVGAIALMRPDSGMLWLGLAYVVLAFSGIVAGMWVDNQLKESKRRHEEETRRQRQQEYWATHLRSYAMIMRQQSGAYSTQVEQFQRKSEVAAAQAAFLDFAREAGASTTDASVQALNELLRIGRRSRRGSIYGIQDIEPEDLTELQRVLGADLNADTAVQTFAATLEQAQQDKEAALSLS